MKKQSKKYYWLLLLLATLGIGYWAFRTWLQQGQEVWRYIPDEAVLVVESGFSAEALANKVPQKTQQVHQIPFVHDATQQLKLLQKLCSPKAFTQFLADKTISYSLHRENKKNLRFVFYVPYSPLQDKNLIDELAKLNVKKYRIILHQYEGFDINEIYDINTNEALFAYFKHKNYLIGCQSTILLEDVVRKINQPVSNLFKENPFLHAQNGIAHIYFRSKALREVKDLLPAQISANLIFLFGHVIPTNPDFVFTADKSKYINASVLTQSQSNIPLLAAFNGQTASKIHCSDLIPQNTASLIRLSFNKTDVLEEKISKYLDKHEELIIEDRDSVNRLFEFRLQDVFTVLGDEATFCELETNQDEPANKLLFLHTKDVQKAINVFDDLTNKANQGIYPKPLPEQYKGYAIKRLNIEQFPSLLFGSIFQGFYQGFYTVRGNYVIYANDLQALKTYIDHLSENFTWRNSTPHQAFLNALRTEAQVIAIATPSNLWSNLYYSLPKRWQDNLVNHEERIKNIQFIGLENVLKNNLVSTQLILDKTGKYVKPALLNRFFVQNTYHYHTPIHYMPLILENLKSSTERILLRDDNNKCFTLGRDTSIMGNIKIKGDVNNQFQNLPLISNNKQLLYNFSGNELYFIERTDHDTLRIFSIKTPCKLGISAVGAGTNTLYLSDNLGQIFKYDVERNQFLKIPLRSKLKRVLGIQTVKIKGQPFVAILEDEGILYLINDKGYAHQPFPISIGTKVESNFVAEEENGKVVFGIISTQGELIKVGEDGNITLKQQLTRSDKAAVFEIYSDKRTKNWLIASKSLTEISIFDKQGKTLLTIQGNNTLQTNIQYFDLDAQASIITLFDGLSNTLYNTVSKEMLGGNFLKATAPAALSYSNAYNKIFVYNPNIKNIEIWTVKVK